MRQTGGIRQNIFQEVTRKNGGNAKLVIDGKQPFMTEQEEIKQVVLIAQIKKY